MGAPPSAAALLTVSGYALGPPATMALRAEVWRHRALATASSPAWRAAEEIFSGNSNVCASRSILKTKARGDLFLAFSLSIFL
jgi:hypothetical protein